MRAVAPESQWRTTEELLATLIEVLDFGNRNFIAAHTPKHTRLPEPIRIPRPGEEPEKPRMATKEEIFAFFGAPTNQGGES